MKNATIDLGSLRSRGLERLKPRIPMATVGAGTCGLGNGAGLVLEALEKAMVVELGAPEAWSLRKVGCFGWCSAEPIAMAYRPGKPLLVFLNVKPAKAPRIARGLTSDEAFDKLSKDADAKIESWDFRTSKIDYGTAYPALKHWNELSFFKGQEKLVLRDSGLIDPEDLGEYLAVGGYSGLMKAVGSMRPESVIDEVKKSKLRGRGGAGFPTYRKWELMRASPGERKYVICNADEGDPGAYMNRNEIESDPHMLVEGMAIGAYAMGASEGLVYVRAEYPLAVERLQKAVNAAREAGILGRNILGSAFSFDLEIATGAGAFVCGEETALIASAEGRAGRPSPRPPFPAQRGLNGCPTNINNVETWCNVPVIAARGGDWFAGFGTPTSTGTKVFSLVGKVQNTGLVELPLGKRLDAAVYGMGGGAGPRKRIKALQSGGPSGGCVPAGLFNTAIDYEELAKLGAIMGSGGLVAMDQDNCMVDVARYFVGFTAGESCGKCAPCREGLSQMLHILEAVSRGEAREEDLDTLEELALAVRDSALCGLGQTAANPVLTTLRYFRDEYERHIREKRCEAGVCESLFLALCENSCPLHMNIPGYLELLKENRLEEAFELTLRENPLPGTIGRICHFHCRMRCKRDQLDEPVAQGEIHRYLADTMYKMGRERAVYARLIKEKLPPTGKKVSIIGAGPAGIAAAFWLVRLGHDVTVYDEKGEAGGVPRWGIPAYRLPKDILAKELGFIRKLGVRFVFNTRIGRDLSWERLADLSDVVLVCVGALRDMELDIPGDKLPGVVAGSRFLEEIALGRRPSVGDEVVVIGGGNTAIDAARSAKRLGAHVTIVYRRSRADMPANAEELEGAIEEGIEIIPMVQPLEIVADQATGKARALVAMKMKAGDIDATGRPAPVASGDKVEIRFDSVIIAVGERVDAGGIETIGVELDKSGRVKADNFAFRTANPKIYAAGDAVTGPATAAEAMGIAKRASAAMDLALMGEKRFDSLFRSFDYQMRVPLEPSMERAGRPARLSPIDRSGSFAEISQGYTGEQARIEAERCLRCDVRERVRHSPSSPLHLKLAGGSGQVPGSGNANGAAGHGEAAGGSGGSGGAATLRAAQERR
jgi:NADH-quinone oxidoreductase subunit F